MRLVTRNVQSVDARLPRLLDRLAGAEPDVVRLRDVRRDVPGVPGSPSGAPSGARPLEEISGNLSDGVLA